MKTGRPCRVCQHPKRPEIDAALRNGEKISTLVKLYGLGEGNLRRHKANHLTAPAEAAPASGNDPSKMATLIQLKTMKLLRDAEASGSQRVALAALRQARENLETLAKVRATEPAPYDPVRDEVLTAIRDRLAATLSEFPEALERVLADFRELAGGPTE